MSLQRELASGPFSAGLPCSGACTVSSSLWRITLYSQNLGKIRSTAYSPLIFQACSSEKRD